MWAIRSTTRVLHRSKIKVYIPLRHWKSETHKNQDALFSHSAIEGIEKEKLPVAPFVVIPGDELHEVLIQSNSSLGIEDAWSVTEYTIQSDCEAREDKWNLGNLDYWGEKFKIKGASSSYLLSPTKSVETRSSSVYPKIPFNLPSDSALQNKKTLGLDQQLFHNIDTNLMQQLNSWQEHTS